MMTLCSLVRLILTAQLVCLAPELA